MTGRSTVSLLIILLLPTFADAAIREADYGERLSKPGADVGIWWVSSGWKVGRTKELPRKSGNRVGDLSIIISGPGISGESVLST